MRGLTPVRFWGTSSEGCRDGKPPALEAYPASRYCAPPEDFTSQTVAGQKAW